MQLISTTTTTGSIVTPLLVLNYNGPSATSLVLLRLKLGSGANLIAGNGVYTVGVLINDVQVMPVSSFTVPNGVTSCYPISREAVLLANDTLKVNVTGQAGDTNVTVIAELFDVTPLNAAMFSGTGTVLVNHNYPTTDNMTLLDGAGMPIVGACIYIYLAADFVAGRLAPEYIVARSLTTEGGVWANPVALNPGSYYAYFFKQGSMTPTNVAFTVT